MRVRLGFRFLRGDGWVFMCCSLRVRFVGTVLTRAAIFGSLDAINLVSFHHLPERSPSNITRIRPAFYLLLHGVGRNKSNVEAS